MLKSFFQALRCSVSKGSGPSGIKRLANRGFCAAASLLVRKKPRRSIVMIHEGRCGSTVVGTILDQQPGVYWDGEVITKLEFEQSRSGSRYREILESPVALGAYLQKRSHRCLGGVYGFEIKVNQMADPKGCLDVIETLARGSDYVVLIRKNLLRRLVSVRQGVLLGNWHQGAPTDLKLKIDVNDQWGESLVAWMDGTLSSRAKLLNSMKELCINPLILTFEDDVVGDPANAVSSICRHAGIKFIQPEKDYTRRVRYRPLEELIENFDEVCAILEGTVHAWMLNE